MNDKPEDFVENPDNPESSTAPSPGTSPEPSPETSHEPYEEPPGDPQQPDTTDEEDFATLLENSMTGVKDDLRVGEEISGEIISIGDQGVFINTGTKVDGVVDKTELLNENNEMEYKAGDVLKLYVISTDDGEIRLSRAMSGPGSESRLYDAQKNAVPVEGRVSETCKGGFRVAIMGKTAFCPVSQMDVNYIENPEEYVGKDYEFLISRIESRGKNIVVSRRDLLNRYIEEEREKFLRTAQPGDIMEARITRIMGYGAFAEVAPGVEGMIHISELGWSRVERPEEVVSANDTVQVAVLGIEHTGDKNRPVKISLSMKSAMADPWTTIFERYAEGDKLRGTVTRLADFGAFVELEPGIEGLVHISEMSHRRIAKAGDVIASGDVVAVTVKKIDPAARRISLGMKDAEGDPWVDIEKNYPIGRHIAGRIEKKEKFGFFIELEPGITGLLPASKIRDAAEKGGKDVDQLKPGDMIRVVVDTIDTAGRKISLGLGGSPDEDDWKAYEKEARQPEAKQQPQSGGGLGDLAEKLKAAMQDRRQDE